MTSPAESGNLIGSSKLLGHISEGLYRGPSGVLQELVSNSFDANSTEIWISTGWPEFDVVSINDNGDGMWLQKSEGLVDGGIGGTEERIDGIGLINGREVIGRLGIGLLGVSQISYEFSVESHTRARKRAFRAIIRMRDFRSEIPDTAPESADVDVDDDGHADSHFHVGDYEVIEIPSGDQMARTTIVAVRPSEGFRLQLAEGDPPALPRSVEAFVDQCAKKDVLATGPLYQKIIWQLASAASVIYLANCRLSISCDEMLAIAGDLERFGFSVIVDGVRLFKPIQVHAEISNVGASAEASGEGPFIFPLRYQEMIWVGRFRYAATYTRLLAVPFTPMICAAS